MPGSTRSGWGGLAAALAIGLLLAWFASATPRALGPDAPPGRFSARRALQDIARFAAVPHPSGSPANARVRDGLLTRLRQLGLEPQAQRVMGVHPFDVRTERTYAVENVLARLPGRDRHAPALLVMSHYDSVPGSPGAADDMAGVASALEIARLLKAGPQPYRDVLFAFTDGEEIGLNGAQALFADPVASRNIGFVLNLEARGGGGRALMFQTGPNAGGAVRLFARNARQPASQSLFAYLYEKMPNDTDFSVSLARGLPGLNYAFIGRPALYHTPAAIPGAVEPGAVQSLGEQAYLAAQAVAHATALPAPSVSPTWFDLFGRWVVVYDPPLGWAPLLVAAALIGLAIRRLASAGELEPPDLAVGALQLIAAAALGAVLLYAYGRMGLAAPTTRAAYFADMAAAGRTEVVAGVAVLIAALLVFRAGSAPSRPCGRWAGALIILWLMALALQAFAPRVAFLAEWPALLASLALLALGSARGASRWAAPALCGVALGFGLGPWHLLALGVGVLSPVMLAGLSPILLAPLSPWLQQRARPRAPLASSALL